MSFHIYHILFRIVERNLVYNKFFLHAQSRCNSRPEIVGILDTSDTPHAILSRVQLEEYIDLEFGHHIQRITSNAVFLLKIKLKQVTL